MTSNTPSPSHRIHDEDVAKQARPGHGIPSQDPKPSAQFALSTEDTRRATDSVLMGSGLVVAAATGAGVGAMVSGPVGILIGASLGAVTGLLCGVAAKKILDSFGAKSLDELAEEVANKVREATGLVYGKTGYAYTAAKQMAKNSLMDYIETNWDTLRVHAQGCSDLDLHELRRRNEAAERAYTARERGESVTIFMHGEKMMMNRSNTPASLSTTKPVTFDQLTEKQRAALGMLKLMEDGASIDDVGTRVDRDTFYLLD